jgi:hypothetical protein
MLMLAITCYAINIEHNHIPGEERTVLRALTGTTDSDTHNRT